MALPILFRPLTLAKSLLPKVSLRREIEYDLNDQETGEAWLIEVENDLLHLAYGFAVEENVTNRDADIKYAARLRLRSKV